ncbi:MAG: outer membrane protein transport protein, partial [Rikenellaceae bacterium]
MKKFILLALAAAVVTSASAEGYQVNTLSAKQLGMAHTGVSQKLNSESVWFNPAAAAYQEQKFTIAGGVTGINAVATYRGADGVTYESDNKLSTPLYLSANYKVNDNLALGLVFNTPFGSSMNWGDNWAGMSEVQSISLSAYNVQPTVSYKLLDGKLSVGAGLMISWGSFELSKSLINQSTAAALDYGYSSTYGSGLDVATATLSGDAA